MTDFQASSANDTRLTFQRLADSISMTEGQFWEHIRTQMELDPISVLSQFLVELGDKLELAGSPLFSPQIRQAAIMLQTLEGENMGLKDAYGVQPGQLPWKEYAMEMKRQRDEAQIRVGELQENINQMPTLPEDVLSDLEHYKEVARERQITIDRQEAIIKAIPADAQMQEPLRPSAFAMKEESDREKILRDRLAQEVERTRRLTEAMNTLPSPVLVEMICKLPRLS